MKKALLLLLILGTFGCDKEFPNEEPKDSIENWNAPTDFYGIYGYRVKDTFNLTNIGLPATILGDKAYLAGLRNGKLWVGIFDSSSKEQLSETVGKEPFPIERNIHLGYGEYETVELQVAVVNDVRNSFFSIETRSVNNERFQPYYEYFLWFYDNGKIHKYNPFYYGLNFMSWHDGSYLAKMNNDGSVTCLTAQGDILFSGASNLLGHDDCFPISHRDFIAFTKSTTWNDKTERYDIPCLRVYLANLQDYPLSNDEILLEELLLPQSRDYKFTPVLLGKQNNIWKFRIDITEHSGEKHSHEVEIDISAKK